MKTKKIRQNEIQFDYFSDNYHQFEEDFYEFSALNTPLTFLSDDILFSMASAQKNYFKLNRQNAIDAQDHYYIFKVRTPNESKQIRVYEYQGHTLYIDDK